MKLKKKQHNLTVLRRIFKLREHLLSPCTSSRVVLQCESKGGGELNFSLLLRYNLPWRGRNENLYLSKETRKTPRSVAFNSKNKVANFEGSLVRYFTMLHNS